MVTCKVKHSTEQEKTSINTKLSKKRIKAQEYKHFDTEFML